ncbi:MAG: tetratricopeptide repeat protein [Anaerolineaceae bacterium]|nr:tetratricopeptide repeat protein [Anaerolineaceae bacterium]
MTAAAGDYSRALEYATRRSGLDPLLEEGHRHLMLLYARSGQRSAALRQYRECVRILEQELGVSPLEETTRLYQEILSTWLGPAPMTYNQPSQPGDPDLLETAEKTTLAIRPVATSWPLVGREMEISRMVTALRAASNGLFISLEGEAGVGKTRLAEEFLAAASGEGHPVTRACCYEGEFGLAYGPFMESLGAALSQPAFSERVGQLPPAVLTEAARLLPIPGAQGREVRPDPLPDGPGAQARFFEALRKLTTCLLGGSLPGILFIDDLHWADVASLDLISYLSRRSGPASFHILVTWRSQEGPHRERLRQLQADQQRTGRGLHLTLRRLTEREISALTRNLFASAGEAGLPRDLETRLYQESEGLPFIALEYLRTVDPRITDWKLPRGVRDLLHQRLQMPGEAARQLLTAGAVIGRSFDFSTLQAVSGRSEMETIAGLEELVELGLIRESDESHYDFTHEKLRQVAYEETSQARRRLLHLRTAETLAAANHGGYGSREASAWVGLAANHFLQGGQPGRAADLFHQAGDQARSLYANDEALAAYQAALAAGHPNPAGLHEACGDLHTLKANYSAAVASYQAAAAFCTPACLSNLMHKLGEVYQRLGEWDAAEGHYQAALEAAGGGGNATWLTHLFTDWSLTSYRRGQMDQAQRLADQALEQGRKANDPGALAQAFNMLGILARASGALEDAGHFLESSLESASRLENPAMRCAALNNLARLYQERDRAVEAIPLARQALELSIRMGDRHRQAAIQNNLADLYHAVGQEEEAMTELKKAVTLFAEIGENTGPGQPEIWKLTEW